MHSGVIEHSFHITCCLIPLTVTRWLRLVDQEHVHSSMAPDLTPVLVVILFLNLCFLVSILLIIVCCFAPFLFAIVLYVPLRIAASDYTFGIFKLIFINIIKVNTSNLICHVTPILEVIWKCLKTHLLVTKCE